MADKGIAAVPRPKACVACRQLKLRCDAHKRNYESCSRCLRLGRDCVISATTKKRTRQTKAQLETELEKLRAQYTDSSLVEAGLKRTDVSRPRALQADHDEDTSPNDSNAAHTWSDTPSGSHLLSGETTRDVSNHGFASSWRPQGSDGNLGTYEALPQTIGGISLSSQTILDCFHEFFHHYAPGATGIFDDDHDPNQVFADSQFLFWTIVYVGSRRYSKDRTISTRLAPPLHELALRTMYDPEHAMTSIRAILALCCWPLPMNSTFKDPSHAMSGTALQLAVQKGLPFAYRKQDFVRVPLERSEKDRMFRLRLWTFCQMVVQKTNLNDGLPCPPTLIIAQPNSVASNPETASASSTCVEQLHAVQVEATTLIIRSVDLGSTKDTDLLFSLVQTFDSRAQQIAVHDSQTPNLDLFELYCVRLVIQCFYFFGSPTSARDVGILQVYALACDLITLAVTMDQQTRFPEYCTQSHARCISLAAFSILRISRSPLLSQINSMAGEDLFFKAVDMCKKRSHSNSDLEFRTSNILAQLWSSSKCFKFKDGTIDGLRLLLRGRLHMSVLFDSLWWWRGEFGGSFNPYVETDNPQDAAPVSGGVHEEYEPVLENQGMNMFGWDPEALAGLPDWLVNISGKPSWQWDSDFDF